MQKSANKAENSLLNIKNIDIKNTPEINSKNEIVIALFSFTIKPFKTEKRDARKADINPNKIPFKY